MAAHERSLSAGRGAGAAWETYEAWKAFGLAATVRSNCWPWARGPVPCLFPHPAQHRPDDGGGDTEV